MPEPSLVRGRLEAEFLGKLCPLAIFAAQHDMLRAVWIVQVKQRSLRKGIGTAAVIRMLGVAVDLDGPELVALYQQRHAAGAERMRRGKIHRLAKHQILWLPDVRIDRFFRLLGATRHSRQRH